MIQYTDKKINKPFIKFLLKSQENDVKFFTQEKTTAYLRWSFLEREVFTSCVSYWHLYSTSRLLYQCWENVNKVWTILIFFHTIYNNHLYLCILTIIIYNYLCNCLSVKKHYFYWKILLIVIIYNSIKSRVATTEVYYVKHSWCFQRKANRS